MQAASATGIFSMDSALTDFSSGRRAFPGKEKGYKAWHDTIEADEIEAWQQEMCVSFITGLDLMTASCPWSLELCEGAQGRKSLNVSSAPRQENSLH